DFIPLNDLSAVEEISCLSYEISGLSSNDVAQRRIALGSIGLVANQVAFRKIFDGNDGVGHWFSLSTLTLDQQNGLPSFETGEYPTKARMPRRKCLTRSQADKADFAGPTSTSEIRR